MELSKVLDGFLDATDTLIIKAQVQVIREKADRPFCCLDCQYRKELVRVYLTNVEQIFWHFVKEGRSKLRRLLEDKNRWKSFNDFWKGMDQNARRRMSREKTNVILKVVVKHFFIEKEVTSTLVMDSLYSGLKALEGQNVSMKERTKLSDAEQIPDPIVCVEKDVFVLVDDVLKLLERAASEPLPPKDEKGPQNRTKDGNSSEDFNKDSIERDERRLTELGRRTVEIFVLAHIFNHKIEVAYQEAIALKRQEELIREEEAQWLAESEQKAKRGITEKEKKSKKKQAKQKRNNRKSKDKGRYERAVLDKHQDEIPSSDKKDFSIEAHPVVEKPDIFEDVSDVSDSVDGGVDILQPESEERDASPVNWDTDTSEVHPPTEPSSSGISGLSSIPNWTSEKRSTSAMDDSSSTCSTDSVPSIVTNGSYKGNSHSNYQYVKSPGRGKHPRGKVSDGSWAAEVDNLHSRSAADVGDLNDVSGSSKAVDCESETLVCASQDRVSGTGHLLVKKVVEEASPQEKLSTKVLVDVERSFKERTALPPSSGSPPASPPKNLQSNVQLKLENKSSATIDPVQSKKASSNGTQQADRTGPSIGVPCNTGMAKPATHNVSALKLSERPALQQVPVMARPSSATLMPGPRLTAPAVSMVQTGPSLARSVSAAGRLGPDPLPANHSYAPLSYRNAIVGNSVGSSSAGLAHANSPSPGVNMPSVHKELHGLASGSMFLRSSSDRGDSNLNQSGFSYGMANLDILQNGPQRTESSQGVTDEFPHIDIINELLDDEHGMGNAAGAGDVLQSVSNGPHFLNRQCSFPGDVGISPDLASGSGSCRFERTRSYHDVGFQRSYSSFGTHFDTPREFIPQASQLPYANGHIDGLIPNQWQMAASDLSLAGMRNAEGDGSPYFGPTDFSNLACSGNGYAVYRPSSGH